MVRQLKAVPIPVLILVISFLFPTEFSIDLGGFRLSPHRAVLIFLLPLSTFRIIARSDISLRSFDLTFLLFSIWSVCVFMIHMGDADGLKYGGSLALESFGGYIVARSWIRERETYLATLRLLFVAVCIAGLLALPETVFGQLFVHDALSSLTGYAHPTKVEQRLGLTRAYGTFDHPIHFGTFAASILAMLWFTTQSNRARRIKSGVIGVITFLGVSSAPILCLLLQGGLIFWERITRTIPRRIIVLLAVIISAYAGASAVMTRSPFAFVATGLTIDPWTGYYRLQIWEHGWNNVVAYPWLGNGLADWVRPWWMISDTVDTFWLVMMMRQGIPSLVLLGIGIALLLRHAAKEGLAPGFTNLRSLGMGWLISLIAMILVAFTVHYWNVLFTYFFFVIGMGGVFADPVAVKATIGANMGKLHTGLRERRNAPQIDDIWKPNQILTSGPAIAATPAAQHDNIWG